MDTGELFLDRSRHFLAGELLPRVEICVRQLPEADLWWRPNEASNSVGNLVLHLAGNVGQWVVSGIGGTPDERQREAEFDTREPIPRDALLERLRRTVAEASDVLDRLSADDLTDVRSIQGRRVTVLEAIYHAVEHFSMHTGQIVYITKLRLARDLRFYEMVDGIPWPTWEGHQRGP